MKRIGIVIIGSCLTALLGFAISSFGPVSLVWVVAGVLFLSDMETEAIVIAILGGGVFDLLSHGNAGLTGMSVLCGLGVYSLARGLGVADRVWEKVVFLLAAVFCGNILEALLLSVLDGLPLDSSLFEIWLRNVMVNSVMIGVGLLLLKTVMRPSTSGVKVKL